MPEFILQTLNIGKQDHYSILPTIASLQEKYQTRYTGATDTGPTCRDLSTYSAERLPNAHLPANFTESHPTNDHDKPLRGLPNHLWVKLATYLSLADIVNLSTCSQSLKDRMAHILALLQQPYLELFDIPPELQTTLPLAYKLRTLDADITTEFKIETLLRLTNWSFYNQAYELLFLQDNNITPQILENLLKKGLTEDRLIDFLYRLYTLQKSYDLSKDELTHPMFSPFTSPRLILLNYMFVLQTFMGNMTQQGLRKYNINIQGELCLTVPTYIENLSFLKSLTLYNCLIVSLPPQIGALTNLETLKLARNQLVRLPPEIGRCTSLTDLNLSKNRLTTLPDSLFQCTKLEKLKLSYNKLSDWPVQVISLTQLTHLNLRLNPYDSKEIPVDLKTFMETKDSY